jgi:hypothetical protein
MMWRVKAGDQLRIPPSHEVSASVGVMSFKTSNLSFDEADAVPMRRHPAEAVQPDARWQRSALMKIPATA